MARSSLHLGPRRWLVAVPLALAGVILITWSTVGARSGYDAADAPVTIPTETGEPAPKALPAVTIRRLQPHPNAGTPVRVVVPSVRVDAPVVPISVSGGILIPPADPQVLGWWAKGAWPGAVAGSALVTGHTVHTGGGQMDDLDRVRPGDRIRVRTVQGVIPYEVTSVKIYRKASLAGEAAKVFRQDGPGRLVLVTCEDWDGSKYLSNVVVLADPR